MTDKDITLAQRRAWVEYHFHHYGLIDEEVMNFRPLPSDNFTEGFLTGLAFGIKSTGKAGHDWDKAFGVAEYNG